MTKRKPRAQWKPNRRNRQHGMDATPTYNSWHAAKKRCLNPRDKDYPVYGGAGVTFCKRWLDFKNFFADMGVRPPGTMLDRIEGSKGYEPGNVRWATPTASNNNRKTNVLISYHGITRTMAEWATVLGIRYNALCHRIADGWPIERALSQPVRYRSDHKWE